MVAGRPSALGRATAEAVAAGRVLPGERLAPPPDLSDVERAEWNRILEPLPPGFITAEHTTLLRELVRCTVFARQIGAMIERQMAEVADLPPDDERLCRVQSMIRTHGFQVEKIVLLSRSLRITKQSRYEKTAAPTKRTTAVSKPWNDWQNTDPKDTQAN
jgi:hypothetical protein